MWKRLGWTLTYIKRKISYQMQNVFYIALFIDNIPICILKYYTGPLLLDSNDTHRMISFLNMFGYRNINVFYCEWRQGQQLLSAMKLFNVNKFTILQIDKLLVFSWLNNMMKHLHLILSFLPAWKVIVQTAGAIFFFFKYI